MRADLANFGRMPVRICRRSSAWRIASGSPPVLRQWSSQYLHPDHFNSDGFWGRQVPSPRARITYHATWDIFGAATMEIPGSGNQVARVLILMRYLLLTGREALSITRRSAQEALHSGRITVTGSPRGPRSVPLRLSDRDANKEVRETLRFALLRATPDPNAFLFPLAPTLDESRRVLWRLIDELCSDLADEALDDQNERLPASLGFRHGRPGLAALLRAHRRAWRHGLG